MQLEIIRLNDQGLGVCYDNGKITFVNNTVVGDIVTIKIIKEYKNYNVAVVDKYISYSKNRVPSLCPLSLTCGGCSLFTNSYLNTLIYKKNKIENILKKYAKIITNIEVIASEKQLNYRNKITLHIKNKEIGYYKEDTHKLIPINNCPIADENINNFLKIIKNYQITNGEVVIRTNYLGELLINFITEDQVKIIPNNLNIKGILKNNKLLLGQDYFQEKIGKYYFNVSYNSFFQVNRNICNTIFNILEKYILKNSIVLDLYCGVGTLGQSIAKVSKKVYGIEIVDNAIRNAQENCRLNNINNAIYYIGDVGSTLSKIKEKIDVVIIDPPRQGLDKKTIQEITILEPKQIIYISCNPLTFARDLNNFSMYKINYIKGLDMFCYTHHCEIFCVLERK